MMPSNLEQLVQEAKGGDRDALEQLVQGIYNPVFRLSFRMLGFPEDAEDAAQEIIIRVITHLAEFRGESAFRSWVYRIACNHLLSTRKRRAELLEINLDLWQSLVQVEAADVCPNRFPEAEKALLVEEVRIGCMQGLLLSLDRGHRLAVILGEIFEVTSQEGAFILEITPEVFRKRLSRGRRRVREFMRRNCGLIDTKAPCRCREQLDRDLNTGWIDPDDLHFAKYFASPEEQSRVLAGLSEIQEMSRLTYLWQQYPAYRSPSEFPDLVKEMIEAGRFPVLNG